MILELWCTQIAFLRLENIKIAFAHKYAISCVYSLGAQLKRIGKLNCCLYRFLEKASRTRMRLSVFPDSCLAILEVSPTKATALLNFFRASSAVETEASKKKSNQPSKSL